jgi:molybdenum cofactor cytidylyltransferase
MGRLKQTIAIDGTPMIRQVAEPLYQAGLRLIVVIGHERERVQEALTALPCEYVSNDHPEDGMFSSVRLGCLAVESGQACLLTPCDCPGIHITTIQKIQATLTHHPANVVIPTFQGKRGHPVGLPAWLVAHICSLPPDTPGLNSLWRHTPEKVWQLEVDDPAVLRDIDTPEDLQRSR